MKKGHGTVETNYLVNFIPSQCATTTHRPADILNPGTHAGRKTKPARKNTHAHTEGRGGKLIFKVNKSSSKSTAACAYSLPEYIEIDTRAGAAVAAASRKNALDRTARTSCGARVASPLKVRTTELVATSCVMFIPARRLYSLALSLSPPSARESGLYVPALVIKMLSRSLSLSLGTGRPTNFQRRACASARFIAPASLFGHVCVHVCVGAAGPAKSPVNRVADRWRCIWHWPERERGASANFTRPGIYWPTMKRSCVTRARASFCHFIARARGCCSCFRRGGGRWLEHSAAAGARIN